MQVIMLLCCKLPQPKAEALCLGNEIMSTVLQRGARNSMSRSANSLSSMQAQASSAETLQSLRSKAHLSRLFITGAYKS
jgi:hypothetical protein